jgi:transcriptional regulator GlxA family with amidase domain
METAMLARLDRSLTLVARSNFGVKEIADLLGFATPYHFSRRFAQAFGVAPATLRERITQGRPTPLPRLTSTLRSLAAPQ